MVIRVFDDYRSYIHFILGFIGGLFLDLVLWTIFFVYEALEYVVIRDSLLGDLLEFLSGYGLGALIRVSLLGLGIIVSRIV